MALIEVDSLNKQFQVYKREKGFAKNVKALFNRKYETVNAVSDISFSIGEGELVGYVGSNGAGKSTTIKMLCGILTPSSGKIDVDGIFPYKNRKANAMNIGVVFGQRSQLNWDLPTEDTFELYKKMYKIGDAAYKRNVEMFTELLEMQDFLRRPVRQLSLGQKMRAEIAIALLHDPKILYLDEPTIGLDVVVKDRIRKFIRELRDEKKTTIMLTTHDMTDIDQICDRIIMIDKGKLLIDEPLSQFKQKYNGEYYMEIEYGVLPEGETDSRFEVIHQAGHSFIYRFQRDAMPVREAMSYFSSNFDIVDITIRNPKLEEIIRDIYQS